MGFGKTKSRRRQAARAHARKKHTCPRCGRVVYGNGYYNHKRACKGVPKPVEIVMWACNDCGKLNMTDVRDVKIICGYCKRTYVKYKGKWTDELDLKMEQLR